MEAFLKKLKNFNELVMFEHTIFSLPFIFIAMVVASNGWFGFTLLLLGVFATVGARNFAMGFNRYVDMEFDKKNPRTQNRPSVDGRINKRDMLIFIILNGLFFIIIAYFINSLALILSPFILLILASYSYFKRFSSFAHLILGLSLGLAPIAGAIAVLGEIPLWSIYLSIGVMFWVSGFDLLYSLQDMEFDREHGLFSIPSKFGKDITLHISKIFHLFAIIFWLLFVINSNGALFAYLALLISAIMLISEHVIVIKDFRNINRAFFTINGYLGVLFMILIIVDRNIYG